MACFPMFVDLAGKNCLIVGGGTVAVRKVKVMQDFGLKITVAATAVRQEIAENIGCRVILGDFAPGLLDGMDIVIAATDDKELNAHIAELSRRRHIPVNAVDSARDSDFIFPSYLKEGEVVAAFSSSGRSPVITQYLKEKNKNILTRDIADIADFLGDLRERVKDITEHESQRKEIYRELLGLALELGRLPREEETEKIIRGVIE